jgi:hypothetical protein
VRGLGQEDELNSWETSLDTQRLPFSLIGKLSTWCIIIVAPHGFFTQIYSWLKTVFVSAMSWWYFLVPFSPNPWMSHYSRLKTITTLHSLF